MNTQQHLFSFKNYMNYRRYSQNTIKTYSDALDVFFRFFQNKTIEDLTKEDLIHFNSEYILKKNLSASYQNQVINAINYFTEIALIEVWKWITFNDLGGKNGFRMF